MPPPGPTRSNPVTSHGRCTLFAELRGYNRSYDTTAPPPYQMTTPMAIEAMSELGIDIGDQVSKSISEFLPPNGTPPDLIISVCSAAETACPSFPGKVERLHWPFDDPAHATGSDEEKMAEFRRVRDEIRSRLTEHFGSQTGS